MPKAEVNLPIDCGCFSISQQLISELEAFVHHESEITELFEFLSTVLETEDVPLDQYRVSIKNIVKLGRIMKMVNDSSLSK